MRSSSEEDRSPATDRAWVPPPDPCSQERTPPWGGFANRFRDGPATSDGPSGGRIRLVGAIRGHVRTRGKGQSEQGPTPRGPLGGHSPAVGFGDLPDEGQAQARAGESSGRRRPTAPIQDEWDVRLGAARPEASNNSVGTS